VQRENGADLYLIQSNVTGAVKIGRSKDVHVRLLDLQVGSPHKLRLLAYFTDKGHLEIYFHNLCRRHKLHMQGEWFHYDCLNEMPDWVYGQLPENDRWWVVPG